MSRYSLAVPDTDHIPPSQSAAYIETNLLYVVCIEKQKQKKHLCSYNRYQTQSIHEKFYQRPCPPLTPKDNTPPKPLLRKSFFAIL